MSKAAINIILKPVIVLSLIFYFSAMNAAIKYIDIESVSDTTLKNQKLVESIEFISNYSPKLGLDAANESFKYASEIDNEELMAQLNLLIGINLAKVGETTKAIKSIKKALAYNEKIGNKEISADIMMNIGDVYHTNNQYDKALIYYNSALAEYKSINKLEKIARCQLIIGSCYLKAGKYKDAESAVSIAHNISSKKNIPEIIEKSFLELFSIYLKSQIDTITDTVLSQTIQISNYSEIAKNRADASLLLFNFYKKQGDYKQSNIYLKKYTDIQHSIIKENTREFEDYLINLSVINPAKSENNRYVIAYSLAGLIMLFVIIYLFVKLRKTHIYHSGIINRSNEEIIASNESIADLNEKIDEDTKLRLDELSERISSSKNTYTALENSYNNLLNLNKLKDLFLSKISHEIRTPLNSILGFSEILENQLALLEEDELFDYAKNISDSGMSLVDLLNNILDISQLNSNEVEVNLVPVNTQEIIQETIPSFIEEARTKGVKIIFEESEITDIVVDISLCKKIIKLLISNSVKFTEKGFIKISQRYKPESDKIEISIKDTGIGIDNNYINEVFEPFRQESLGYSTSYQGAGLGLPLAKKMAKKLGGDIKIESQKGVGTTATIILPAHQKQQRTDNSSSHETDSKDNTNQIEWQDSSILVVEDDKMNQILYAKMLKNVDKLEIAKDGKTALSIIEKNYGKSNFDIVLMDFNLPVPWNGITLMKEIRKRWPEYENIPFVAQTAYAISGNKDKMLNEGFDGYLSKPIVKKVLIDEIINVLSKK